MAKKLSIADLYEIKRSGRKITALSCYDYTTARLISQADIDMLIVGDSAAQVVLGYENTLRADMDFMVAITAGVSRGADNSCVVADMPFLSYQTGIADAVKNAGRFVTEGGARIVKIEANSAHLDVIKAVSDAGIAVMAHIGIRPQNIVRQGKLRAEGTTAEMGYDLVLTADKMIRAGASSLLIEGTAREVAGQITQKTDVPVISCGSGPDCDGQVLVISDVLGLTEKPGPKFSKTFGQIGREIISTIADYREQVKKGKFPDDSHCYHMKKGQNEEFMKLLSDNS